MRLRIWCCGAVVTNERHKGGLLPLNLHRPIFASVSATLGGAVGGSPGAALLGNARSLAVDDRLLHVEGVLTSRGKPALVTKDNEERVERAAAATRGLAQKVLYSKLVIVRVGSAVTAPPFLAAPQARGAWGGCDDRAPSRHRQVGQSEVFQLPFMARRVPGGSRFRY